MGKKSVAVWLICLDGENAGKVLLQQRAATEIVDGVEKPQANPYICQPTWNEKVEPGEVPMMAVRRGAFEELGPRFAQDFLFNLIRLGTDRYTYRGKRMVDYNFIGLVHRSELERVRLHSGAMPNFVGVGAAELPFVKSIKNPGVDPTNRLKRQIVLFEDQYKTLLSLFRLKSILYFLR